MKVCFFSLSLTGISFTFFQQLFLSLQVILCSLCSCYRRLLKKVIRRFTGLLSILLFLIIIINKNHLTSLIFVSAFIVAMLCLSSFFLLLRQIHVKLSLVLSQSDFLLLSLAYQRVFYLFFFLIFFFFFFVFIIIML